MGHSLFSICNSTIAALHIIFCYTKSLFLMCRSTSTWCLVPQYQMMTSTPSPASARQRAHVMMTQSASIVPSTWSATPRLVPWVSSATTRRCGDSSTPTLSPSTQETGGGVCGRPATFGREISLWSTSERSWIWRCVGSDCARHTRRKPSTFTC